ncbi:MAG: valine--tRNA ligase, partial [Thermodesulfobacteriota bacterium]
HELESITVMDLGGVINEEGGRFKGLDRFTARVEIIKALQAEDLLEKTEPHKLMLGSCYRCSTVVEPTLSRQWFVDVKPLAGPAIKAVKDGKVRFVPKNWENLYFDWMNNIRDWCISRQIWWGHRIPAWHCADCAHTTVAKIDPAACGKCGSNNIEQDHDVLDTWFSSALWPFSTLGWPDKTAELSTFYPTNVLSTSFDIIFFWVARMIMMGLKFMDDVPFRDVYIHALIRDSEGQKMSKSKGNVIDPLVMIEQFGTDAFRFTLAVLAAQGRDIKLAPERIEGYRNFCNKLWNLTRFTLMNIDGTVAPLTGETPLSDADKWILTRLSHTVAGVTEALESYRFDEAARLQYGFVWHELCDWYVELSKKELRGEGAEGRKAVCLTVLTSVLRDTVKLLHPFMPFITEEIHSFLPGESGSLLAETYPEAGARFDEEARGMELVMGLIKAVRNIKTEMNVTIKTPVTVYCFSRDKSSREALLNGLNYIENLAGVKEFLISETGTAPANSISGKAGEGETFVEIFVPMKGLVDVEVEGRRLNKALEKVNKKYVSLEKKLSNKAFLEKAPPEIVKKEKTELEGLRIDKASIEAGLERLKTL